MMKKILSVGIFCFFCVFSEAQLAAGVRFEQELDWSQIKEKAKLENKYIFIDCYTTWCGPCRRMDKEVYPDFSVGEFLNVKFVSLKLQMDTTARDSPEVKRLYRTVNEFYEKYNVRLYPTFLFFTPGGKLVHKGVGVKSINDFIHMARESTEPGAQYFTLLEKYKNHTIDNFNLRRLANLTMQFNEKALSLKMASDYMSDYLASLSPDSLCQIKNLMFINSFKEALTSHDKLFDFIIKNQDKVDIAANDKGFSRKLLDYIILKEEISPYVSAANVENLDVDWNNISKSINKKYGSEFASRNVLEARVDYYFKRKDWHRYTKYLVKKIDFMGVENVKSGVSGALYLNNSAWYIFQYSNNKYELKRALEWSCRALLIDTVSSYYPGNTDTKANLLYKLGNVKDAILVEKRAVSLSNDAPLFKTTLQKMVEGVPTW